MSRPDVRHRLLDAGVEALHRRGFNGCGVQEIADAAGVPKGSFYNHFDSKEALGAAVLERYWQQRTATALRLLDDDGTSPRSRLMHYFATLGDGLAQRGFAGGCLIGNLSAELSDQSPLVRDRLATIFAGWTAAVAACIRAGQACGEIAAAADADSLAGFLLNAWEGAILRARIDRSGAALAQFQILVFTLVLPLSRSEDRP